jgi:hypothetical protein
MLSTLFTVPFFYARGTMTSVTTLAALAPGLPEDAFLTRLLGSLDLFLFWQLFVLSIGLGVLYKRRTQPIATALVVVTVLIVAVFAWLRRGGA